MPIPPLKGIDSSALDLTSKVLRATETGVVHIGSKKRSKHPERNAVASKEACEASLTGRDVSFDYIPLRSITLRMLFAPKLNYTPAF